MSQETPRPPVNEPVDTAGTSNGSSGSVPGSELPGGGMGGPADAGPGSSGSVPGSELPGGGMGGRADAEPAPAGRAEGVEEVDEGERAEEGEEAQLSQLRRERDDYLDALRRLQADFENYKKRMLRQQGDQLARAAESLVEKLLPVLDTADLAVAHGGEDAVAQLRAALTDTLGREGLERIDPVGESFDPNVADAVAHEPAEDGGGPTVAEVLRAGYRWKGRVVRPAMVKVKG